MNLTLIIPIAGKSSRFGNGKPKCFLTHPYGNLMFIEAIKGLDLRNINRIVVVAVKKHIEETKINLDKVTNKLLELTKIKPEFLILPDFTSSQSETVYEAICQLDIKDSIFIKDCDNYFNIIPEAKNSVCISTLEDGINAINKSYVSLNKFGSLSGIVEKSVIGNKFCVGGYSFESAKEFANCFKHIKNIKGISKEIYISHIIQQMLINDVNFEVSEVSSYCDWGTIKDWLNYTKEYKTIFVDLDGVLVENGSEYFQPAWGESAGLKENINLINNFYDGGKTTIIITTSRKEEYKEITFQQLNLYGIKYHKILFDLPHAERILINDYSATNPHPSAIAINLNRNNDNLKDFLKF